MLDDAKVIKSRDSSGILDELEGLWRQSEYDAVLHNPEHDSRKISNIVIAGCGGSAESAGLISRWLRDALDIPYKIVHSYELPGFVGSDSLVICSSYSGDTKEVRECLDNAINRNAQIATISSNGRLSNIADSREIVSAKLPQGVQPRFSYIYSLKALVKILVHFGLVDEAYYEDIYAYHDWLKDFSSMWGKSVTTDKNMAKQLALMSVGKTPVFCGGYLMYPVINKWKNSWNKNAKNLAFISEYPDFLHNGIEGWVSHPIEKPFVVFDFISPYEHPSVTKGIELSDKALSGKRPKSNIITMQGDTILAQLLWGYILADFVSVYVAILNGVDPYPVKLIDKIKQDIH